jgi:Domain of unknown function (DUF4234)
LATYELHIRDAPAEAHAKLRSPVITVVLSIVTIGIYYFVWYYKINREMRDLGRARGQDLGQSPATSVLATTLGALIIVPAVVSVYNTCKRIQAAQRLAGRSDVLNGWLAVVMYLVVGFILPGYMQSELNKVWTTQGEPLPGVPPHPSLSSGPLPPADPTPPPAPATSEAGPGGFAPPQAPPGPGARGTTTAGDPLAQPERPDAPPAGG